MFPHRPKERQGSLPSSRQAQEARADGILLQLLAPSPGPHLPGTQEEYLSVNQSDFQSTESADQGRKLPVRVTGKLKENHQALFPGWRVSNPQSEEWNCKSTECSWQQKRSRALPLCTGFLLNEQLPRASHPSWVRGTQKGIACPPYNWEHACQPTG